ncbi:MAG: CHAP domain-containing protein [Candidatus Sulfotelmatobacter sp.]
MNPGDALAQIAESQIGTRGDLQSGRTALYGYLLATDAKLSAFEPEWARRGFGADAASRYSLFNQGSNERERTARFRLLDAEASVPEFSMLLHMHSWCAAFVDWCVLQLLLKSPHTTSLTLTHRPRTASAFGLLHWGMTSDCYVSKDHRTAPERGDIAVFNFLHGHHSTHHTGIVTQPGRGGFYSVEGNTTPGKGGNQGYLVAKRWRAQAVLKGFIRLPPRDRLGDYNISSRVSHTG